MLLSSVLFLLPKEAPLWMLIEGLFGGCDWKL